MKRKSTATWNFRIGPLRVTSPASALAVTLVAVAVIVCCCCVPYTIGTGV